MQFVVLIYQGSSPLPGTKEWDALPTEEHKRIYTEYEVLNKMSGFTGGLPLGLSKAATTVRVSNGSVVTSSGPYDVNYEPLGGYGIIEAQDLEAAITIASKIPAARLGGAIEIRPVAKYW
jgi:hypothetical protein